MVIKLWGRKKLKMKKEQEEKYDGWLVSPKFSRRLCAFIGYNLLSALIIWSIAIVVFLFMGLILGIPLE